MTDRLKMNSIQLAVLSLEKQEITSKCFNQLLFLRV